MQRPALESLLEAFDFAAGLAEDMALQPDGKVVEIGTVNVDGQYGSFDVGVVRFRADRSVDTAFGDGGRFVLDLAGASDEAGGVAVQSDGKVVMAASVTPPNSVRRGQSSG